MSVTVFSQNLREGLALPQAAPAIAAEIDRQDADVVIFTDSFSVEYPDHNKVHGASKDVLEAVKLAFKAMGYSYHAEEYGDYSHPYPHDRNVVTLTRGDVTSQSLILATRFTNRLTTSEGINLLPLHGHDGSGNFRTEQGRDISRQVILLGGKLAVIGDYNNTHGDTQLEKLIARNDIGQLSQLLLQIAHTKYGEKIPSFVFKKLRRLESVFSRVASMTHAEIIEALEAVGLNDADPNRLATYPALLPIVQLDHVMTTPDLRVEDFKRLPRTKYTDHRGQFVRLSVC